MDKYNNVLPYSDVSVGAGRFKDFVLATVTWSKRTSVQAYRPDIDGLRALAVLAVVIFHAFPTALPGGFVGVDIFFIISGYLISRIVMAGAESGEFSFRHFYIHRIRRIFPALLVVLCACYAVGWRLLDEGDFGFLGKHVAGGAAFVSNFVLWNESGYFDPDGSTKPLLHLWSLGVEEQFYLVWPVIVLAAVRFKWRRIPTISLVALVSFGYNLWMIKAGSAGAYYSPLSRFWELLTGALGACLVFDHDGLVQRWRTRVGSVASIVGLALIAGSAFFLRQDFSFPGWWAMPSVFGALAIVLAGPDSWANRRVLSNRAMVWAGLISYPLYLWHWPILTFWNLVAMTKPTVPQTFGLMVLAVVLATLVYLLIERPIRRFAGGKTAVMLLVLMIGIGYAGYNSFSRGGLPFRSIVKEQINQSVGDYLGTPPTALNCSVIDDNYVPPKACLDASGGTAKPLVFIWGDSHTANVSYGFTSDKVAELDIRLAVAMKGGCPPVIGYQPTTPSQCQAFVDRSLGQIRALKPDVVMLTGEWALYFENKKHNPLDAEALITTIATLKKLGVKKVIVVGCFPVFEINQSKLGRRFFVTGVKDRTFERFDTSVDRVDVLVRDLAKKSDVDFISPLDYLCNEDGCLISASSTKYRAMAYDLSHMTYPGSQYFVDRAISKATFLQKTK